jgi:cytochrome c oxidase assembly protein subunit 15
MVGSGPTMTGNFRRLVQLGTVLVALTILAGGFVAGLHAGLTYNTFPLMDGALIPAGYADLHPFLRNLTENIAAVQFDHRLLATLTLLTATATVVVGWTSQPTSSYRRGSAPTTSSPQVGGADLRRHDDGGHAVNLRPHLIALGIAVLAQYALGIATLLTVVPVGLAAMHQAGAAMLLTAQLVLLHALRTPGQTPPNTPS